MLTKLLAPLIPLLIEAIFDYLKKNPQIVDRQVDRVTEKVTAKLPDLSKLDDRILELFPDLSKLPAQVVAEVATIPAKVIGELKDLLPFPFKF